MDLRCGWATNPGRVRALNEDSLLVAAPLFLVADGMGGHAAGEVASRIAIETMRDTLGPHGDAITLDDVLRAVEAANLAIIDEAGADASQRGMGTTLTGVAAVGDRLAVVNVGDSRVYLLRAGTLQMVTHDHTYVEELLAAGEITAEQARVHPHRHVITHALGIEPGTLVDSWVVAPVAGDRFMVCSDGLTNEVDDPTLAEVLRDERDPQRAADTLVRLANDFGGRDNVTVVVVDVVDVVGSELAAGGDGDEAPVGGWLGDDIEPFETTPPPPPVRPPDPTDQPEANVSPKRRRATVAAVVFVLAVVAVLVVGVVGIEAAGRRGYFVDFDDTGTVAIYQGTPGGVLWVGPSLERTCAVHRDELSPAFVAQVEARKTFTSADAASQWCADLLRNPDAIPSLVTTTTTEAPTTTLPPLTLPTTTEPATSVVAPATAVARTSPATGP